ncbi:MAG: ABC transporter ATP-binding protein [Lachnospiraceae bacterium]
MLSIRDLRKTYGNYCALDGLDMEISKGALYGFVGPNGAGKTTTIRIVSGLLYPDSGSVVIDGVNAVRDPNRIKEKIGYVPDYFGVYDNLKVCEYMEFFASCYGITGLKARKKNQTLLAQIGLEDKKDAYVDGLSRGMKQRLCLARALIHDPELLIMDEPTAGLDPRTRVEFREMIRELQSQGKTILISSHLLEDLAEMCTDIGVIDQGKMVLNGNIEEIFNRINTSRPLVISIQGSINTAMRILKDHDLVRTITVKNQEIMIGFDGDVYAECELLAMLVEAGVFVHEFMRESGNLEAVFMKITNHEEERVVLSYEDDKPGL